MPDQARLPSSRALAHPVIVSDLDGTARPGYLCESPGDVVALLGRRAGPAG